MIYISKYLFIGANTTTINVIGPRYAPVNNNVTFSVEASDQVANYKDVYCIEGHFGKSLQKHLCCNKLMLNSPEHIVYKLS